MYILTNIHQHSGGAVAKVVISRINHDLRVVLISFGTRTRHRSKEKEAQVINWSLPDSGAPSRARTPHPPPPVTGETIRRAAPTPPPRALHAAATPPAQVIAL